MSSLREIHDCEVCGGKELRSVLDLGNHPMCDDLVPVGDSRVCREYPIEILFCDTCRTAHQRFQIPKHDLFPSTYHYRSRHTADVLNGMRQLVEAAGECVGGLAGKKVLDIGCNDGSLLSFFREKGAATFGIEPTGAAADASAQGHEVVNDYLCEEVARAFAARFGKPDVITFTNVFAHIEDLHGVVRSLKELAHPGTTIVVENHYLGAVIEKRQFDTFYHEHPRTYSFTSFVHIARSLGMEILRAEFPKRYGGNVRVFLGAPGRAGRDTAGELSRIDAAERGFGAALDLLSSQIAVWRARKRREIEALVLRHGRLPAKAFPGRAAIPVKMLGLDETLILAAYEKPQSGKIGHYIPGTRIPIVSDAGIPPSSPDGVPLLNLAWHIAGEIHSYMREHGWRGPIIDIIAPEDFTESA